MLDHHPEIAFEKEFDFVVTKVSDAGEFPPLDAYLEWIATVAGRTTRSTGRSAIGRS